MEEHICRSALGFVLFTQMFVNSEQLISGCDDRGFNFYTKGSEES